MRVAILTPGEGDAKLWDNLWRTGFDRLAARFEERGHAVFGHSWTAGPPVGCDLVLPLLAWGYHHDLPRWLAALDALDTAGARVMNPTSCLRWNADKRYLSTLEMHGVGIVPTVWLDHADEAAVAQAARRLGAETIVVKPQVSGGAEGTIKIRAGEPLTGGPTGAAMVQPFLPSIGTSGELSMLYFGGVFSHALTKTAVAGDFRCQPVYGGVVRAAEPDAAAFEAAETALRAVQEPLLYARVDIVRDDAGDWRLMELELIEPYLFLDEAPDRGARFVDAVEAAVANS